MKRCLNYIAALLVMASTALAQEFIRGTVDIAYNSRIQTDESGRPLAGVHDIYKMDNVMVSTLAFRGIVEHQPGIYDGVMGIEKQPSYVKYALDAVVKNPANLEQEKNIGRMVGTVQVDKKGVYLFDSGNVRFAIDGSGAASGFESPFRGRAAGRPTKVGSLVDRAKSNAITLTKKVKGQTIKLVVSDFDRMAFQGLTLAAGPVKAYPEALVNGEMLYDYERSAWYFNGLTIQYTLDGRTITDKITGNIKWSESPQRATNGEGKYSFDVRVNEPQAKASGESEVFAAVEDEAAFFSTDVSIPGLTGEMRYKDRMSGDTVQASNVTIDLGGNQLTKQQIVNLYKLICLVSIVPLNAE